MGLLSMASLLVPLILCGGAGTRLWPMSRQQFPKQFLQLVSTNSMLQDTVIRAAQLPGISSPYIVCNEAHRFLVGEQLRDAGIPPKRIILEPAARNTAPAVAVAALAISMTNPDAIMLVLPADHMILHQEAFGRAVDAAVRAAQVGSLVTFGIVPDRPETGYGYIQPGNPLSDTSFAVQRFVEKPDAATAASLVKAGYLWNSGMFVMSSGNYIKELGKFRPDILDAARLAWERRVDEQDFCRLDAPSFASCPAESIDYAVMEHTGHAAVVPTDMGWNDVGSWASLWEISDRDMHGNAVRGDVEVRDTRNSYLRAESRLLSVTGMDDVIVVETGDAVLVTRRDQAQSVKDVVSRLKEVNRTEHALHRKVYRPWGYYESIDEAPGFQVKRLMVKPGEALSLQLHNRRAEHWVVVSGTARVTCGDEIRILKRNQSTYIPLGTKHRLENPTEEALYLIEVQSGDYLGEDDIVRFEDRYRRT